MIQGISLCWPRGPLRVTHLVPIDDSKACYNTEHCSKLQEGVTLDGFDTLRSVCTRRRAETRAALAALFPTPPCAGAASDGLSVPLLARQTAGRGCEAVICARTRLMLRPGIWSRT